MSALDDAFHKLDRGKEHIAEFYTHINITFQKYHFGTEIKSHSCPKPFGSTDTRSWEAFTLYVTNVPIIEKRDEILFGEAIQSFRSSLDYLAWVWATEAAKRCGSPLTEQQERKIMFPMVVKGKNFSSQVNNILPNITSKQRAFIKKYQPYKRSDIGKTMRYLTILSNTDKHRIIVPALMSPQVGAIQFDYNLALKPIKEIHYIKTNREVKAGTKIMTVVLAGTVPNNEPKVRVNTAMTLMPMFPREIIKLPPPKHILIIEEALNRISAVCTEILTKARDEF